MPAAVGELRAASRVDEQDASAQYVANKGGCQVVKGA
jgi:hypothetical protein